MHLRYSEMVKVMQVRKVLDLPDDLHDFHHLMTMTLDLRLGLLHTDVTLPRIRQLYPAPAAVDYDLTKMYLQLLEYG